MPPPALLNQVFTWSWEGPQAGLGEDRDPLGLGDPQSLRPSLTRSTVGETRHQLSGLNEKDATFASEFRCTVLPSDPPQTITADGRTDGREPLWLQRYQTPAALERAHLLELVM